MRILLVSSVAFLLLQEGDAERRVAELIRGLREEGLDAREQAAAGLVELGAKAVPALRKAAAVEAHADVKARIEAVLQTLERRARIQELGGTATLVSINAEAMPLKQAIDELNRQSTTRIQVPKALADIPVTLSVAGIPLLEALDRICRSAKGVTYRLPGAVWSPLNPPVTIALAAGDHDRHPRIVKDRFILEFASVSTVEESDFSAVTKREMSVVFRTLWEHGTRPLGSTLRLTALVDDSGTSYLDVMAPPPVSGDSERYVAQFHTVKFGAGLPAGVKGFREIAGEIEFSFPVDVEVLTVREPLGKVDREVKGEGFAFVLASAVRDGARVKVVLKTAMEANPLARTIVLRDRDGHTYGSTGGSLHGHEDHVTAHFDYDVPAEKEIDELRVTIPKPGVVTKLPFRFVDVKVRPR